MPRTLPVVALVIGAALTLSACSGGPGGGGEKLTWEDSPLQEYLGAVYGSYDEDDFTKQQQETEELVAQCMSEEGFDYIPVDQSQNSVNFNDEERETLEWVSEFGYGVNLTQEEQEELYGSPEEFVDPNQDYVMSLSESEMTEYYAVLYGQQEEVVDPDEEYVYNWEDAGCYGWAQHEIQGDQAYEQEQFTEIFDSMNALYEDTQKDPRLKELNGEWASCMADAGYDDFKLQFDAAQSIYDKQNSYWEENPEGEGPDEAQIKEWRDEEVEVAVADFECKEKTDYTNASLKIQFELEEEFIAENKAELDALVAFAEENRK